jgi:Dolichyl-phosphate-mannose-protein mannosyltransferase
VSAPTSMTSGSRFGRQLGAITIAALVGRVAYVLAFRRRTPAWGDAFSYHYGANLLAHGKGFIDPLRYLFFGIVSPSAYHPPLYTAYLAGWTKLGVDTVLGHRLVSCLLGAATVAVVGLIGRELGTTRASGERIGIIAAAIAALSPALWTNDVALLSEPVAQLAVALAVLALLRYRARPTTAMAVVVGALCGIAALSRAELVLLFPLLCIPMARWASPQSRRELLRRFAGFAAAGALIVAPWVAYNLTRFDRPVYISTGLGATLSGGACDAAFSGPKLGYWDAGPGCGVQQVEIRVPVGVDAATPAGRAAVKRAARTQLAGEGDESVREADARRHSLDYIRAHEGRLPVVVLARVGRLWGVFRPWQTATFDATIEGRGFLPARLALGGYWLLAVASVPALVLLHRRKQTIAPFVALAVIVTLSAALSFGIQRYRAPFDVVMPALAAVSLEALWIRRSYHSGERSEQATELTPIPRQAP